MACRNSRSGDPTEAAAAICFRADSSRQPICRTNSLLQHFVDATAEKGGKAISRLAQMAALVQFEISESHFPTATSPATLLNSQSDSLMEVALFTGIVSFMLPASPKGC